jgi:hypothetical protein
MFMWHLCDDPETAKQHHSSNCTGCTRKLYRFCTSSRFGRHRFLAKRLFNLIQCALEHGNLSQEQILAEAQFGFQTGRDGAGGGRRS